jgi:delta 1-pyrroline-5-carboxylate dehydrogenase
MGALVTGNAVLFNRRSDARVACVVEILHEAGVPPGARLPPGVGEEVGAFLVEHRRSRSSRSRDRRPSACRSSNGRRSSGQGNDR